MRRTHEYTRAQLEQALEDAVAAIVTGDPTLAPARVLDALDFDGENLGLSGRFAKEVERGTTDDVWEEAETLFFARLEQ